MNQAWPAFEEGLKKLYKGNAFNVRSSEDISRFGTRRDIMIDEWRKYELNNN